jgi:hypothetical protein
VDELKGKASTAARGWWTFVAHWQSGRRAQMTLKKMSKKFWLEMAGQAATGENRGWY